MNRTTSMNRRYRKVLTGGLIASAAVHAALVAFLRFDIPILDKTSASFELLAPAVVEQVDETEPVTEVVRLVSDFSSAPAEQAGEPGAAALPPQGSAAAAELAIAAASAAPPIVEVSAEPAFEQIAVIDPISMAAVRPVAFDALPAAETTAPSADEDDGIELYVPGSIGKAKRQWARGMGEATDGEGSGIRFGVIGMGGGGHCPMPGRVPVSK